MKVKDIPGSGYYTNPKNKREYHWEVYSGGDIKFTVFDYFHSEHNDLEIYVVPPDGEINYDTLDNCKIFAAQISANGSNCDGDPVDEYPDGGGYEGELECILEYFEKLALDKKASVE